MRDSLRAAIERAINDWCSETGNGIPVGFVYCVKRIDEDGDQVLTLGGQENQHTSLSLGLVHYLRMWVEDDVATEIGQAYVTVAEDEDD